MTTPDHTADPRVQQETAPAAASLAVDIAFTEPDLFRLRAEVAAHTGTVGDDDLVHRALIVTSELATNVVRHGGGAGRLRLWTADQTVVVEVSDRGHGIVQANPGMERPDPMARGGRGIWFCRQLAEEFAISTGPAGTTATAGFRQVR